MQAPQKRLHDRLYTVAGGCIRFCLQQCEVLQAVVIATCAVLATSPVSMSQLTLGCCPVGGQRICPLPQ